MNHELFETAAEVSGNSTQGAGVQSDLSGLKPEASQGQSSVAERIQTPVTQSSLNTLNSCEELYRLKYVLGLLPATEDLALSLGSAYHRGLEMGSAEAAVELFKNSTTYWTQADRDNLSINSAIVEAMVGGALRLWGDDLPDQREVQFTLPLINPETGRASTRHVFRGVIDGLWNNPIRGAEYKTAGRVDKAYIDRLQLDFQVGAMLTAIGRLLGVDPWTIPMSYRIAKKPQSRQRKNESVSEFAARIKADYIDRPEFYFHDLVLRRSEDQMKRWQHEAWRLHQRILYIENGGFTVRNTRHCTQFGRCAFLDLCCGSVGIDAYRIKDSIHPELENNNV
tara:strand:+ start:880 stop:1893 length:1014 start_codon:yes stop_codon:yes gene_type:complete